MRRVLASVDWGFTNPGVIGVWFTDGDDRLYLFHQVYQTKRLIGWWVDKAKKLKDLHKIETFVCDPSEPAYIQEFNDAGLHAIPAINDVLPGIQAVQMRMCVQADGKPRIFFMRDSLDEVDISLEERFKATCVEDEVLGYVFPEEKDGKNLDEKPVKVADHGMDMVRYMVMYLDNTKAQASQTQIAGLYKRRKVPLNV